METKSNDESGLAIFVAWLAFTLAIVSLALFGCRFVTEQDRLRPLYESFHADIPAATKFVLAIPALLVEIIIFFIAAIDADLQFRGKDRRSVVLFHILIILGCCIAFLVFREIIQEPLWSLMQAVRGSE
jgi:hypothetical protein